ncbi:MAG: AmmeMemoRadiSam system protein B [Alphaproteobacteria bacterium]
MSDSTQTHIRPAAIAGTFYPAEPDALTRMVDACMAGARDNGLAPKALIAPHAGYIYSGPIAASAYQTVADRAGEISRVVLLGPPHKVAVRKFCVPSAHAFRTPLGDVPIDSAGIATALTVPGVEQSDIPHAEEHSLEIHLPFLQRVLGDFTLVPVIVGGPSPDETDALLKALWGGPETLVLISSDLSHYHDYDAANRLDQGFRRSIETLSPDKIEDEQACGRFPVKGLLARAHALDLRVTTLDVRNSGDTGGRDHRDRVVGYGAWALEYASTARLPDDDRAMLIDGTKRSIANGLRTGRPAEVQHGSFSPALETYRAAFVTLTLNERLRGCVGSILPHRSLIADVAGNGYKAAFGDPRFPKLTAEEAAMMDVSVSILSHPRPIAFASEAEAVDALQPDVDGVILQATDADGHTRRGLFLPQVWAQVPAADQFLRHLKAKAGLPQDHWDDSIRLWRYTTETFH